MTQVSEGYAIRTLKREMDFYRGVDLNMIKRGDQPFEGVNFYLYFRPYIDDILEAKDLVHYLRAFYLEHFDDYREHCSKKVEISNDEFEIYLYYKELSTVDDNFLTNVIVKSRDYLQQWVQDYKNMRGF